MKHHRSPYEINAEINSLINDLEKDFNTSTERKILDLLNRIDAYPDMSRYQLSFTKKALGDCYFSHNITGNAKDMYEWCLEDYGRLPVKRRLASLRKVPADELTYSLDIHSVSREGTPKHAGSAHEYDPQHEAYIKAALEQLGSPYKEEFYRLRSIHEFYDSMPDEAPNRPVENEPTPCRESFRFGMSSEERAALRQKYMDEVEREFNEPHNWDMILLNDMIKSKQAENTHETALASARNFHPIDSSASSPLPAAGSGQLTKDELHFLKYIHHKPVSLPYIPEYFTYKYHLDYCHALQEGFIQGIIRYAPASFALKKKKVADLKNILQSTGFPTSGKKSVLINTILENVNLESYSSEYYELTEHGKALVLQHFPDSVFY